MRRLFSTLFIAATVLVAGCATDSHHSSSLTNTLNAYGSTLRWGDFQSALDFVDPKYRQAHPLSAIALSRYQQVRVSGYDAGQGAIPVADDKVNQTAQIGIINRNTQRERSIVDHQTWQYDPVAKHWWLESGLPDITQSE